jgi:hypothetical protein
MFPLRQILIVACLLGTGLALGCSSKGEPMKNGSRVSGGSQATQPVPINPFNSKSKKVLPPEPDSPPPPPLQK